MINSRDSSNDFKPNSKIYYEVPFEIGTILELKKNHDVLAKICQYRFYVANYKQEISVGLTSKIYDFDNKVEKEITVEELLSNWKKPDKIVVGRLDQENGIKIPGLFSNTKKLELKKKKK